MSLWLSLVKVTPAFADLIRDQPDVLDQVLFDVEAPEGGPAIPAGFDLGADVAGYRFEIVAELAKPGEVWLAVAVGIDGAAEQLDYEMNGGHVGVPTLPIEYRR